MEMTIDEAITEVQQQKLDYQEFWEEYKNEHIEALDMAIDTMRKYQKIQEIVKSWKSDTWNDGVSYDCMVKISEVLEDGNDD